MFVVCKFRCACPCRHPDMPSTTKNNPTHRIAFRPPNGATYGVDALSNEPDFRRGDKAAANASSMCARFVHAQYPPQNCELQRLQAAPYRRHEPIAARPIHHFGVRDRVVHTQIVPHRATNELPSHRHSLPHPMNVTQARAHSSRADAW